VCGLKLSVNTFIPQPQGHFNVWSPLRYDVSGLEGGAEAITAGWSHTCALNTSGGALCWGYNFDGQLGNGYSLTNSTPVVVVGFEGGGLFEIPAVGPRAEGLLVLGLVLAAAMGRPPANRRGRLNRRPSRGR